MSRNKDSLSPQALPAAPGAGGAEHSPREEPSGKAVSSAFNLLPHEVFFGLFLVITWLRLCLVEGARGADALLYLALLSLNAAAVWYARSRDTQFSWRVGLLFYPVAMNVAFMNMRAAIPKVHPVKMDTFLRSLDAHLVGTNLSLRLQPLVHPVLTEFFSACYFLFFVYLLFSLVYYFAGDLELLKRFMVGLFTIYGLGFIGYSFVPASGPCHAMAGQFNVALDGWWITRLNNAVVLHGSNGVDVFPSLHCAISTFFLFFDRRHRPWRFKLYLLPCVGLWLSTIYLRYHYFVDVACGFALAGFGLWLAKRFPFTPLPEARPPNRAL
ncbi:MAG TPA: phosphatase PAP2 family protein [Verrucomicrobiae bacterium]|nr:phosphatase PAP2 family protein [Verrucomicrobiae bacterium]